MKYKLFLIGLTGLMISFQSFAQSKKNFILYAYSQTTLPGTAQQVLVDEQGNETIPAPNAKKNYLIYVEHRTAKTFRPQELWLGGIRYSFKTEDLNTSSVEAIDNSIPGETQKIILVPETNNSILRIILTGISENQMSQNDELKNQQPEDIALLYKKKCRKTHTLKSLIIPLPSISMM